MFIDNLLSLSASQAVTVTAPSAGVINLGSARDIGIGTGDDLKVLVTVPTAFTAAGAATLQIQLQTAIDPAFTVPITVIETDALPVASLVAGFFRNLPIPPGLGKQYFRVNYVVGTGPMTAGAISAAIVDGMQGSPIYPAVQP